MATPKTIEFVKESISRKSWTGPIIDLGAGIQSQLYKPLFNNVTYVTLDIQQDIESSIDILADICNMPKVPSGSFGVTLLLETLEHLKNPFSAFAEISRITKRGGIIIITTVASWVEHKHPADYWRFMPDGLNYLCRINNLEIFYNRITARATCIPCQVMVAAIKQK